MMNILCISCFQMNDTMNFTMYMEISSGKYYEVVGDDYKPGDGMIKVINDTGSEHSYPVKIFDMKQFNREIFLNEILT